jgi:hypothetical protein
LVELQPSKLNVASSSLVSRSIYILLSCYSLRPSSECEDPQRKAHVAQSVERFLGKEEVHRFNSGRGLHHFSFFTALLSRLPMMVRF